MAKKFADYLEKFQDPGDKLQLDNFMLNSNKVNYIKLIGYNLLRYL